MTIREEPGDLRWWKAKEGEAFQGIRAKLRKIRGHQRARRQMYKFYAELYGTTELGSMGLSPMLNSSSSFIPPILPWNVVRNGIETVVARIGRDQPLPQVFTSDGDWKQQRRAMKMSDALDGTFQNINVFRETKRALRLACVFGTGFLKVFDEYDKPAIEAVFPWELDADRADAIYGKPRTIYHTKWYDKDVLKDLVREWVGEDAYDEGDYDDAIENSQSQIDEDGDTLTDERALETRIQVSEAWHLPSREGATDGRHVICIDGKDLLDEPYEELGFPFAAMRYKDPLAGFYGDALAAELAGFQVEINITGGRVRDAHYMSATGTWLVPEGSDVLDIDLNNAIGAIIRHRVGMPPVHLNVDPLSPQTYQYLKDLPQMALADAGISLLSAQSQKPSGDLSGKALDSLDDSETGRFASVSKLWEDCHVDIGKLTLSSLARIAKRNKKLTIRVNKRQGFKTLIWKDFALDTDEISVQVYSTNAFARSPQSRLQQVTQLFSAKVIDKDTFNRLSGNPDLEAENDITSAMKDLADQQVEWMLDAEDSEAEGAYQQPAPLQDLVYALHRAQQHWCLAKMRGVPAGNAELLLRYMEDCKALLAAQNPAPAAPPTPQGAPPPSAPLPPGASPPPPAPSMGMAA